jgi:hypothetical protein
VVNEDAAPELGTGMDFDPGEEAGEVRNQSGEEWQSPVIEPMGKAMQP